VGRNFLKRSISLLFVSLLLSCPIGSGGPGAVYAVNSEGAEGGPTGTKLHIQADRLVSRQESNYIHFIGNVDVDADKTQIQSSELKVFYEQLPSSGTSMTSENIKKIVASGQVTINLDNRTATCDRAVYQTDRQVLVLTGETVEVTSEDNSITGNKITFNRKTGEIIVDGGTNQRVNAVIHGGKKNHPKPKKQ